jgi:adenylate cyclase
MAVLGYVIASRFTVSLREISAAAAQVADGNFELRVDTRGDDEVAVLAHSFNYMVSELQEGSIYRDLLGRAVSPEVREELRRAFASNDLRLDGQAMVATVMLTDISGFTTLSEKQAPTTILAWLNEYFNELVPLVTTHGGVVDKFEGDALLVFFGILPQPLTAGASAYAACRAAVAMQAAIHDLNTRRAERGHPPMLTGIGLNTGEVTAGSLGTADRLNYTIIGDVVNTTQRLESFTRTIEGCGIVISQETYTALGERRAEFDIVSLGPQRFKGKTEAVAVYHLRNHTLEPGIRAA